MTKFPLLALANIPGAGNLSHAENPTWETVTTPIHLFTLRKYWKYCSLSAFLRIISHEMLSLSLRN